jgi:hypothetical protein
MGRFADDDEFDDYEPRRIRRRRRDYDHDGPLPHSGLGIASCVIAACAFVFIILLFAIAGMMSVSQRGEIADDSAEAMVLGGILVLDAVAMLVGLILGIVGIAQGRRNKLFAGIGLGANALLLLGVLGLFVITVMTQGT